MAHVAGTLTLSSAGNGKTFNLGIAPTWAKFTVCEKSGGDLESHRSQGIATSTFEFCMSTFADATGGDSFNSNAHVVQHYERSGGVITKVLSASFNSFTATGLKLDVDIANANYQVLVEAGN